MPRRWLTTVVLTVVAAPFLLLVIIVMSLVPGREADRDE